MRVDPLLTSILLTLTACRSDETMCMSVPADTETCPAAEEVDPEGLHHGEYCDLEAVRVVGDGELGEAWSWDTSEESLECCYEVRAKDTMPGGTCMIGRPFTESGTTVLPRVTPAADEVARGWARIARLEHASVAAFARLSLQLMGHGAPLDLLAEVQAAAADEVRHARLCYELAGVRPGRMDFGRPVDAKVSLAELAAAAVREGCIGETIGAVLARQGAARARGRAAAVLAEIADDEARHAALSWGIVAWALGVGGDEVRAAVEAAFDTAVAPFAATEREDLVAHGLFGPRESARVAARALEQVVEPAKRELLPG